MSTTARLLTGKPPFTLNDNEYCYNTEYVPPPSAGGVMKMYVPKLMATIGFGEPIILPEIFGGDAVFGNDSSCKPSASKSFNYQNYINIPLLHNVDSWEHILDGAGKVPKKTKFLCNFLNGEVNRYHFTTNL